MVESATSTTGSTVTPDDSAAALRIGWTLAEVRGRLSPAVKQTHMPLPEPPALRLDAAHERSVTESQVEAVKVLAALSQGGTTDMKLSMLTFEIDWKDHNATAITGFSASQMLRYLASRLIWSRTDHDLSGTLGTIAPIGEKPTDWEPGQWWDRLALFLWAWDEAIQDQFATQTFGTASSYQLGRGLSESYWALDPSKKEGSSSWAFLLGKNRVDALIDICQRLAPIVGTLTARAVEATLQKWGRLAAGIADQPNSAIEPNSVADPSSAFDAYKKLEEQTMVWRDLLVTGRDPLTMVNPHDLEKAARRPWPLVRAFRWELALMLIGIMLIGLGAAYFSKFLATFLTVLGAVGITATGIAAWAKNNVQKVGDRVRASVNLDVVVKAVTKLPVSGAQQTTQKAASLLAPPPKEMAA